MKKGLTTTTSANQLSENLHLSCPQCRKKKIKCDRKYPCGQCKVRGEEANCESVIRKYSTVKSANEGEEEQQQQREIIDKLLNLEKRVQELESRDQRKTKQGSNQNSPIEVRSKGSISRKTHADHERVSLMVEDVAMGHLGKRNRFDDKVRDTMENDTISPTTKKRIHTFDDTNNVLNQRTHDHVIDVIFLYNQFIPSQESIKNRLIEFYFSEINWFTNVLDEEEFMESYKDWKETNFDIKKVEPTFFCCFLMILCLSLHMIEEEELLSSKFINGIQSFNHINLSQSLFIGSQQILWSSNFLGNCQLNHLACICLMGLYQYDKKDESDAHWILLGSAIKAAQNMGLDDINKKMKKQFGNDDENAKYVKRCQDIWSILIWYDWSHAFGHDGHYSIVAAQTKDWISTSTSKFTFSRAILVNFYRTVTDLYNETEGKLTQEQIDDLDVELTEIIQQIPNDLIIDNSVIIPPTNDIQSTFERYFISLTIQNRILRLHRPFQVDDDEDEENVDSSNSSRQKCLQSALKIVSLIEESFKTIPTLCKFWVINLYCLGAGLVLIIEQSQRRRNHQEKSLEIENSLNILLNIFSKNQRRSASARNAFKLLRILQKQQQQQQQQQSSQRNDFMSNDHHHHYTIGKGSTIMKQVADLFLKQAVGGSDINNNQSEKQSNSQIEKEQQQSSSILKDYLEDSINLNTSNNEPKPWNLQGNPSDLLDFTFSNWQDALNAYGVNIDFDQIS